MAKGKKRRGYIWAIIVLCAALAVICGVIVLKQREYAAGTEFYDGLRGLAVGAGIRL